MLLHFNNCNVRRVGHTVGFVSLHALELALQLLLKQHMHLQAPIEQQQREIQIANPLMQLLQLHPHPLHAHLAFSLHYARFRPIPPPIPHHLRHVYIQLVLILARRGKLEGHPPKQLRQTELNPRHIALIRCLPPHRELRHVRH